MAGVHEFDTYLQDANSWLNAIMEQLKTDDARIARTALKAAIHALRDRIPPHSAVHLGDQLPTLVRGIYYENWSMPAKPTKERHLQPFLDHLATEIPRSVSLDPKEAAYAVFEVMSNNMDHGEIAKIVRMLPLELRDLWPLLAQLDAAQDIGDSG